MSEMLGVRSTKALSRFPSAEQMKTASVIGSGPNGLSAAIVLAQAGFNVDVYEAEAQPGGAARTLPLTLPGYLHDTFSSWHPLFVSGPAYAALGELLHLPR